MSKSYSERGEEEVLRMRDSFPWEGVGDVMQGILGTISASDEMALKHQFIKDASWIPHHKKKQISITAEGVRFKQLGMKIELGDSSVSSFGEYSQTNTAISLQDWINICNYIGGTARQQADFFKAVLGMEGEYWTSTSADGFYGKTIHIGELFTTGFSSKDSILFGRGRV